MAKRVIIIGLDGGTFSLIEPWTQAGFLPNLASLIEKGIKATLMSTIPPLTPLAWSTFITGCQAGQHGLFDFVFRDSATGRFRISNAGMRKCPSLWKVLSEYGLRVGVLNVPFTYPPEKVNGFLVAGMDAPIADERIAYPDGLYRDLIRHLGVYFLHEYKPSGRKKEEYVSTLLKMVDNRIRALEFCLSRYACDFTMVVFSSTDHVQHFFWDTLLDADSESLKKLSQDNPVLRVYRKVDEAVGRILEKAPSDADVIIISDHGFGHLRKLVNINNLLIKHGILVLKSGSGSMGKRRKYFNDLKTQMLLKFKKEFKSKMPPRFIDRFKNFFPGFEEHINQSIELSDIDWSRTRAFSSGVYGYIFINKKSRDLHGIVTPEQEDDLIKVIEQILLNVEEPGSGYKPFSKVHSKSAFFNDDSLNQGPDLIMEWNDWACCADMSPPSVEGEIFKAPKPVEGGNLVMNGIHRMEGIMILKGPSFIANINDVKSKRKSMTSVQHLQDIAPTVMNIFGIPLPEHVEGKVLHEYLSFSDLGSERLRKGKDAASYVENKKNAESALSEDEEKEIRERLKGFGYFG